MTSMLAIGLFVPWILGASLLWVLFDHQHRLHAMHAGRSKRVPLRASTTDLARW